MFIEVSISTTCSEPETMPAGKDADKLILPLSNELVVTRFSFVIVLTILPLPSTILIEPVEIYKSLQIFDTEPKSNVFVIDGTNDELKFAVTVTVSDMLSPIVILPPSVKLPEISASPEIFNDVPVIAPNEPILPVPAT